LIAKLTELEKGRGKKSNGEISKKTRRRKERELSNHGDTGAAPLPSGNRKSVLNLQQAAHISAVGRWARRRSNQFERKSGGSTTRRKRGSISNSGDSRLQRRPEERKGEEQGARKSITFACPTRVKRARNKGTSTREAFETREKKQRPRGQNLWTRCNEFTVAWGPS